MQNPEIGRPSRWMIRVMEWNDPRARYPNIWQHGMPRQILAFERLASRLRLGDLVAVYYPTSGRHPERSDRFIGVARVIGLRRSDFPDQAWLELETAHRFDPPLDLGETPRRVFMCCDPGWPSSEVALYQRVLDAACAAGWQPTEEERNPCQPVIPALAGEPLSAEPAAEQPAARVIPRPRVHPVARDSFRIFAGAAFSGDMRDPREATCLAILELRDERLRLLRLEATGRSGLQASLRNPDRALMQAEAIGLDFPFGLPRTFAETLAGEPFAGEGWWALARRLERLTRPDYLVALQQFREANGEVKRWTDERSEAFSPLHRASPDLGPMTYHGIRMIAEDRSRYAIRPFENAQGRLLLEVYPEGSIRRLGLQNGSDVKAAGRILDGLGGLVHWPVDVPAPLRQLCIANRQALEAVVAARCAALAVLTGEADRKPDELDVERGQLVRVEGWIYGLDEPS